MFRVVPVTISPDTSIFASGDLIADTEVVANFFPGSNQAVRLHSVIVTDSDDQGAAFDIYCLAGSGTFGTENSAPSPADAVVQTVMAVIPIATGDYKDLGGARVAHVSSLNRILQPIGGSTAMYVAVVNGSGTPTYTASGLTLKFGIEY